MTKKDFKSIAEILNRFSKLSDTTDNQLSWLSGAFGSYLASGNMRFDWQKWELAIKDIKSNIPLSN